MKKKRPHYLVDGYNLMYVWENLRIDDLAAARDFLIRNLHEYGAYEKLEITLVFDAARSEDEERIEVYDDFFRVVYSAFNETADNVLERLSYEQVQRKREVLVVSSDAIIETVILGAGAYRHPSREFYRAIVQMKKFLRKKYLDDVMLPVVRNEVGDRLGADVFAKLEKLRRAK